MEELSNSVPCSRSRYSSASGNAGDHVTNGDGAKYKLMSPAKLPISRSTFVAAPSGFSPTPFLESPVLLSNFKAEPSPTTGSLFKPPFMQRSGDTAPPCGSINFADRASSSSFEFKLHAGSSTPGLSSEMIPAGLNRDEPVSRIQDQYFPESSVTSSTLVADKQPSSEDLHISAPTDMHGLSVCSTADELTQDGRSNLSILMSSSDQKDSVILSTAGRKTDEGYNWRKYGQKVVKGSEFPRSYYKCTYPNCEVKKIFERSPSGQITEIVYKGSHDHPKPQANRRHNLGALMSRYDETMDRAFSSFTSQDDNLSTNSMERKVSSALSPRQGNEGLAGPCSHIQDHSDGIDEDDQFSKLRKIEDGLDYIPVVKPIREPRVIVQTMSEVDILDDGYRWRKYGQKVVRGNPNPRSYYKCTAAGCTVRKHVERASHDPKSVLTTYEGKHNHDLPTAKPTNHEFSVAVSYGGTSNIRAGGSSSISLDLGVGTGYFTNTQANEQWYPTRGLIAALTNELHGNIRLPTPTLFRPHSSIR